MALLGQLSAWNCSAGNIRSAGPRICEKRAEIGSVCEDDAIAYPVPLRTERAFRAFWLSCSPKRTADLFPNGIDAIRTERLMRSGASRSGDASGRPAPGPWQAARPGSSEAMLNGWGQ